MTSISKAEIHEHSITLWLCDKYNNALDMTIPCASRKDRADLEDCLLSAGVQVTHPEVERQQALYDANPALKQAAERKETARLRMQKAHESSTYQEFNDAGREWSQAFNAHRKLANA